MIIIIVLKLDLEVDLCHKLGSCDPGQRKSKKWLLQFENLT